MTTRKRHDVPLLVGTVTDTPPTKRSGGRTPSDLETKTGLNSTDVVVIHQADGRTFQITVANLLTAILADTHADAMIYTVDGDSVSPVVQQTGIGTTPVLLTLFESDGHEENMTADAANNKITVQQTGDYAVSAQFSFSGTLSTAFVFELYKLNTSPPTPLDIYCRRMLGTGGDVGSCSFTGLVDLTAGDEIGIYVNADGSSKSITMHAAQLVLNRVA